MSPFLQILSQRTCSDNTSTYRNWILLGLESQNCLQQINGPYHGRTPVHDILHGLDGALEILCIEPRFHGLHLPVLGALDDVTAGENNEILMSETRSLFKPFNLTCIQSVLKLSTTKNFWFHHSSLNLVIISLPARTQRSIITNLPSMCASTVDWNVATCSAASGKKNLMSSICKLQMVSMFFTHTHVPFRSSLTGTVNSAPVSFNNFACLSTSTHCCNPGVITSFSDWIQSKAPETPWASLAKAFNLSRPLLSNNISSRWQACLASVTQGGIASKVCVAWIAFFNERKFWKPRANVGSSSIAKVRTDSAKLAKALPVWPSSPSRKTLLKMRPARFVRGKYTSSKASTNNAQW